MEQVLFSGVRYPDCCSWPHSLRLRPFVTQTLTPVCELARSQMTLRDAHQVYLHLKQQTPKLMEGRQHLAAHKTFKIHHSVAGTVFSSHTCSPAESINYAKPKLYSLLLLKKAKTVKGRWTSVEYFQSSMCVFPLICDRWPLISFLMSFKAAGQKGLWKDNGKLVCQVYPNIILLRNIQQQVNDAIFDVI